jgi:hypothetical protein
MQARSVAWMNLRNMDGGNRVAGRTCASHTKRHAYDYIHTYIYICTRNDTLACMYVGACMNATRKVCTTHTHLHVKSILMHIYTCIYTQMVCFSRRLLRVRSDCIRRWAVHACMHTHIYIYTRTNGLQLLCSQTNAQACKQCCTTTPAHIEASIYIYIY